MSDFLPPPPASDQPWAQAGPYGYTNAPMPPLRSLRGLAMTLTILFAVIALADGAAAAARMNRANLLNDVADAPLSVDFQDLLDADDAVAATAGIHSLLALAIAVVFIIWQWRHAKNAQTLGVRGGLGPGWAIGGWFIPIANFVIPGLQMFSSSKGSDVEARRSGSAPKGAGIIIPWAITFALAAMLLAGSGALLSSDDDGDLVIESQQDIEDAASSDQTAAIGLGLFILAAVLGIGVVRTLTPRQQLAYEQLAAAAPAGGAPAPPPPGAAPPPPPPVTPAPPPPTPPAEGDFQAPE